MKRIISERFLWLSLKEVAFTEVGCVSNKEIEHFPRHANQLFLGISIGKLQKTKFGNSVTRFMEEEPSQQLHVQS